MSPNANSTHTWGRELATEGRLSKIETTLDHQNESLERIEAKLTVEFFRVGKAHDDILAKQADHQKHLESLLETRQSQRRFFRWALGIATTVAVAAILAALKLHT